MSCSRKSDNRRVGRALRVGLCALAVLALAASPAGAFKRTLKVTFPSHRIIWGLAVDRGGDMFAAAPNSIPGAGFDTALATKVIEMTPQGHKIREISGRVLIGGDQEWVAGDVGVTPNGGVVFLSGGVTPNGSDFQPFVGEYSAATGRFIRGSQFDLDPDDFGGPVAVDSTGQHVYLADSSSFDTKTPKPTRIFELNVAGLSPVTQFTLHGSPQNSVESIAVGGPDDDVFVTLVPSHDHDPSLLQVYKPDGTFVSQSSVSGGADVAVSAHGDIFTGGAHGFDMHGVDGTDRKGIATTAPLFGVSVDGSGDLFGIEGMSHHREAIVKFTPQVPQTRIVGAPPAGLTELKDSPTVTFKFKSSTPASTFECRLKRSGFDTVPFAPCTNPQTFPNTPNGVYRLDVRAVSADGAPDPSPASVHFKVAATYAHAKITSHPAKLIAAKTATFGFTSSTPGATFKCRLTPYLQVPKAFKTCASPMSYPGLTHDVYSFQVEAVTTAGLVEPSPATYTFAVDPDKPKVTVPVANIAPGQQVAGLGGIFNVTWTWTASDPNTPAGQLLDTLQVSSGATAGQLGPFAVQPGADHVAGQTSVVLPLPATGVFDYRGQATNALGVTGTGPATGPVALKVVDDGDSSISYSSGWSLGLNGTDAIGGKAAKATAVGAKATLHFKGTSIAVIAVPAPGRGVMHICVDAKCTDVNTDAPAKAERELVFAANDLDSSQHKIEVTAKTAPVVLDAFDIVTG